MKIFKHRRNERLYALIIICVALLTLIALTRQGGQHEPATSGIQTGQVLSSSPALAKVTASAEPVREVGSQASQLAAAGLDYTLVQSLLNQIAFDERDNLLLGEEARQQLDAAVALIGFERTGYELSQLNNAISEYLPEIKARQVNDLLTRYYQYKSAEHDFLHGRELSSVEDSIHTYVALREMRKSYLNDDLSAQLFEREDHYMDHTIALMSLGQDQSLSHEEREQRMAALQKAYASVAGEGEK